MNILEIKIRDIPWEQVNNHFLTAPPEAKEVWEKQLRGRFVTLTGRTRKYDFQCRDGSSVKVLGYETTFKLPGGQFWACELCAEIGD